MLLAYKEHKDKEGYDTLIVGHTHRTGRIEHWYFNSGSWAAETNNFLRINDEGKVNVFDWIDGRPIPNEAVLQLTKHT